MELRAHHMPLEPLGPWAATRIRRPQDMDLAARARHAQLALSTQSGPSGAPCRYALTREAPASKSCDETTKATASCRNGYSSSSNGDCPITNSTASTGVRKSADTKPFSKPLQDRVIREQGKYEPEPELQRPGLGTVLRENEQQVDVVAEEGEEEEQHDAIKLIPKTQIKRKLEAPLTLPFRPSPSPSANDSIATTKRIRDSHDVDGPETDKLPIKKRRLLLRLVTSRLSRPFSFPATYLVIRKRTPVLHRMQFPSYSPLPFPPPYQHQYQLPLQQHVYSFGTRSSWGSGGRVGGHQSSVLIRKAAILNRIRIRVRQAASSRSSVVSGGGGDDDDAAARVGAEITGLRTNVNANASSNGIGNGLLLSMPALGATGAGFPSSGLGMGMGMGTGAGAGTGTSDPVSHASAAHWSGSHLKTAAPLWRHHSPGLRLPIGAPGAGHTDATNQYQYQSDGRLGGPGGFVGDFAVANILVNNNSPEPARLLSNVPRHSNTPSILPVIGPPRPPSHTHPEASEEEDNTAFPASSFRDRYADLSDDDMDDVYADFGVLFGPRSRSPEARAVGSPVEEQCYEEYLDELDGIPWVF